LAWAQSIRSIILTLKHYFRRGQQRHLPGVAGAVVDQEAAAAAADAAADAAVEANECCVTIFFWQKNQFLYTAMASDKCLRI